MKDSLKISDEFQGRALRSALDQLVPGLSSKGIRRAIQRGQITVNGKRVSSDHKLSAGDEVFLHIEENAARDTVNLKVIFEDDHMAIIDKPAGLAVSGTRGATVSSSIGNALKRSGEEDALVNPLPVHRIDKPTAGLLVIAKTKISLKGLANQFQDRNVSKRYTALVYGRPEAPLSIEIELDDQNAKTIIHDCRPLPGRNELTLLTVEPVTGRTHQIRKHLALKGFAIAGDHKYGRQDDPVKGLRLFAHQISLTHPVLLEPLTFQAELPAGFTDC